MLTPVEICEQLTVDEFIGLCQQLKPFKFDIVYVKRYGDAHDPVVFVKKDVGGYCYRERIEVQPWPISA